MPPEVRPKESFFCVWLLLSSCWAWERKRIWSAMWKSFASNEVLVHIYISVQILFGCWTVVSLNVTPPEVRPVATGLWSKEQWAVPGLLTLGGLGHWGCFSGESLEIYTPHWPCPDLQAMLLLSCSMFSWSFCPDEKCQVSSFLQFNPVHAWSVTTTCRSFSRKRIPRFLPAGLVLNFPYLCVSG